MRRGGGGKPRPLARGEGVTPTAATAAPPSFRRSGNNGRGAPGGRRTGGGVVDVSRDRGEGCSPRHGTARGGGREEGRGRLTPMTTVSSPLNLGMNLSPRRISASLRGRNRHITLMLHSAGSAISAEAGGRAPASGSERSRRAGAADAPACRRPGGARRGGEKNRSAAAHPGSHPPPPRPGAAARGGRKGGRNEGRRAALAPSAAAGAAPQRGACREA